MPIDRHTSVRFVYSTMVVEYRDELGVVREEIDENGVGFLDGKAYFNDKVIDMENLVSIREV